MTRADPRPPTDRPLATLADRPLRRFAATALGLHVAAFVGSVLISGQPVTHPGQAGIEHSLVERGPWPVFAGMFLLALGFLSLLAALTYLSQALGRRTAVGSLAAQTAWATGIVYVTVIVGVGLAAGGAGLWALAHGTELATVLAVNNIRNFAYFAALPCMGVCALTLGIAALDDRVLTRWVGWGGVAVGAALLLAVPAAAVGIPFGQPLWLVWLLGVAVSLARHSAGQPRPTPARGRSAGDLNLR